MRKETGLGKTPLQRLGIEPPKQKGHPLLILCVNGEARPLSMEEYAKLKEQCHLDARVPATSGGGPRAEADCRDDAAFNKQCAAKRHCLGVS